ncbi:hypothetical protein [Pseudomonas viridiflava]|uniref:hypothetical protein n=1 Tax=Pseudomonas viridiflava TaxID=33069 RepID=UPI000F0226AA|nr:hypothetical protein [Pseudomonas viridiflava]
MPVFVFQCFARFGRKQMRKKQKQLYVALVRKFILVVLFSDEKIVSICACGNISPYTGYVQYRYGTPNDIEMIFPQEKIPPEKRIFVVNASEGSVSKDFIKEWKLYLPCLTDVSE